MDRGYGIVQNFLDNIKIDNSQQSTAIGNAIASSLNASVAESKSKVIILITDGANNAGENDPLTAADGQGFGESRL
jgi:Ca-activated chloride channel family protein